MQKNPGPAKVTSREQLVSILQRELPSLRQRYGVKRVAVYGSFAHGRPGPRSDVDLLVELERPLGLEFVTLVYALEDKLGRSVEVGTFESLAHRQRHPRYRDLAREIERTLVDVEAAPR